MVNKLKDCSGFCPECGSDLAFSNLECKCKNPDCDWTCGECKEENGNLEGQTDGTPV